MSQPGAIKDQILIRLIKDKILIELGLLKLKFWLNYQSPYFDTIHKTMSHVKFIEPLFLFEKSWLWAYLVYQLNSFGFYLKLNGQKFVSCVFTDLSEVNWKKTCVTC